MSNAPFKSDNQSLDMALSRKKTHNLWGKAKKAKICIKKFIHFRILEKYNVKFRFNNTIL